MNASLSLSARADSARERIPASSSVSPGQPALSKASATPAMILTVETAMEPSSRRAVAPSRIQRSMFPFPAFLVTHLSKSPIASENQVARSGNTVEPAPARRRSAEPRASNPLVAFLLPLMAFLKNWSTAPALVALRKPSAMPPTLLPSSLAQAGMWRSRSGIRALCRALMLSVAVDQTPSETAPERSSRSLATSGTCLM